jgi:hypothetical protein
MVATSSNLAVVAGRTTMLIAPGYARGARIPLTLTPIDGWMLGVRSMRHARRQRMLRRGRRMERKAENRLIEAWRRAADLRARSGFPAD